MQKKLLGESLHCLKFLKFGGGATRPLPKDEGAEKLHRDSTVGPRPKVWTRGQNGRRSAKDGVPERIRCRTIQK